VAEQTDDRVLGQGGVAAIGAVPHGADMRTMVCPSCGFENLQGDDECANCGADLRAADIPQATTPFERLLVDVRLRALETGPPVTVSADARVRDVLELMRTRPAACILVTDQGRLAGIFTERDALMKLAGSGQAGVSDTSLIADLMTRDPVVLRADDSVAVAVQKMAVGGFRHIPLVDDGRPTGVVSAADVFRHILRIVE
jgi:CBS domain-containing protein